MPIEGLTCVKTLATFGTVYLDLLLQNMSKVSNSHYFSSYTIPTQAIT